MAFVQHRQDDGVARPGRKQPATDLNRFLGNVRQQEPLPIGCGLTDQTLPDRVTARVAVLPRLIGVGGELFQM
jgi:hypothetical protein